MFRLRLLGAIVVIAAACSGSEMPSGQDVGAQIDRVVSTLSPAIVVKGDTPTALRLADRLAHYRSPGVSIAVADSGRIVWARGFGLKSLGGSDSVTPTTLFQAASISKPVAATAMLRLVQDGRLELDRDVNEFLTSWQLPENRFTATEKVTLRRLASHSAGLTVHGFPGYEMTDSLPSVPQVLDGAKPANTGPVRVDTAPGAIFRYSGGGTTIMQLVMMDVTGRPFPAVLKELALDPAGMTLSTYEQPLPSDRATEAATGHSPNGDGVEGRWHVYPEMAAAGLWTTPSDLLKWSIAIAEARAGKTGGVLEPETVREMLTVQKEPTGIGPFLAGDGDGFNFGHGGANEGFRSQVVYFPELGRGAAVMSNSDNGSALIQEILYAIAAEYGWPGYGPREIEAIAVDSARLVAVSGTYKLAPGGVVVEITTDSGRLFVEAPGALAREEFVFVEPLSVVGLNSGMEVSFELDAEGQAVTLVAGPMRAARIR